MIQEVKNDLDQTMDFLYSQLVISSYYFGLKTGLIEGEVDNYPNVKYAEKWRNFFRKTDYDALLNLAFDKMRIRVDGSVIDLFECMSRCSYFALIHPEHPNITLGFIKDADLWDIWLNSGIFKMTRELMVERELVWEGARVLDFGCGSASPLFYSEFVGESGYYSGVEYSPSLSRIASIRIREKRCTAVVRNENIERRLNFKRSYDVVLMSFVLEHVENLRGVMKNALSAIDSEGIILINTFLFSDLEPEKKDLMELYFSLIPSFKSFPSLDEILEFLEIAGVAYKYDLINKHTLRIEINGK
jgi:SAM-dependent methyltransferase